MLPSATPLETTDGLFFGQGGSTLDRAAAESLVRDTLTGADDGELFLEYRESEALSAGGRPHPHRRVRYRAGLRAARGGGRGDRLRPCRRNLRCRAGAARPTACAPSRLAMRAASPPSRRRRRNQRLYSTPTRCEARISPSARHCWRRSTPMPARKDPRVTQVMASMYGEWQAVQIMRADGSRVADLRPLVRLNVSVVVERDGRRETGSHGTGGRFGYEPCHGPRRSGAARSMRRCARRWSISTASPPRPARWRWCSAPAGPAFCCTKRSAMGWRAISTARRPRPSRACSASGSRRPA